MKHRIQGKKFSRNTKQRKALFLSLILGIIKNGSITTTLAKAKGIQPLLEKLITLGKKGSLASRRLVFKTLRSRKLTNLLVDEIAPLFKSRSGGYSRVIKLPPRLGDSAKMAKIELLTYPEVKKVKVSKPEVSPQLKEADKADKKEPKK